MDKIQKVLQKNALEVSYKAASILNLGVNKLAKPLHKNGKIDLKNFDFYK